MPRSFTVAPSNCLVRVEYLLLRAYPQQSWSSFVSLHNRILHLLNVSRQGW